MGREFEVRREVDLPGTPEQVWEAVSTEGGLASWLFPETVAPEAIKTWDPPHRLVVRTGGEGGWFNALEYTIEGREGGATLRYVHSGIFDDEGWDDQYDAVSQHTGFYLHTLGQYLAHFAPRTATYVGDGPGGLSAPEASMRPDGFDRLKAALGLAGVSEGEPVEARLRRRRARLRPGQLRRHPHRRRAVPLLRAQRVRRARRDGAARLRRRRRRAAQAGAAGLAGRHLRLRRPEWERSTYTSS